MAKINVWKNRNALAWLAWFYHKTLKPGEALVLQAREEAEKCELSENPEERARAKELYALEKERIGDVYYACCTGACEKLGVEIDVEGRENIPNGTFCVIANHQSYIDVVAVGYALGGRQISFIAKQALEKLPFYGKFIRNIRGIYIPTEETPRAHVAVINKGVSYLKKGFNMAIFPEGTRSWGPRFFEGGFKKGSLQLAFRAGVPILPIALEGGYHTFEENRVVQSGKVVAHILPPIATEGIPKNEWSAVSDQAVKVLKEEVVAIQKTLAIHANDSYNI